MKKYLTIIILLFVSGCIFNNDSPGDSDGWSRASIPEELKGTWKYAAGTTAMTIGSSTINFQARVWHIREIHGRDDELRIVLTSIGEWMAFYFKDLKADYVRWGRGDRTYTLEFAKQAEIREWLDLLK